MSSKKENSSERSLDASCGTKRGRDMYEDDDNDQSHQSSNASSEQGSLEKSSSASSDSSNKPQSEQLKTNQILTQDSTLELESAQIPILQAGSSTAHPLLSEANQPPPPPTPPPTSLDLLPFDEAHQSPPLEHHINLYPKNQRGNSPQRVTNLKDLIQPRSKGLPLGHHGNKPAMQRFVNSSEVASNYRLPTSILPPESHLEASSTLQMPVSQLSSTQIATRGSEESSPGMRKLANWHLRNQLSMHERSTSLGSKESQVQGWLHQAALAVSSTLYSSGLPSQQTQFQNMPTQGQGMATRSPCCPIHMESRLSSGHNMGLQGSSVPLTDRYQVVPPSSRRRKTRRAWQNDVPSSSSSIRRMNSRAPSPRYLKNSLYDPMYEAMGLPVDPILRFFLLQNGNISGNDGEP